MLSALYIWDADYPWDVRVEKICKSLSNNGYRVHIAARNLKKLPVHEVIDGIHIHRLKSYRNDTLNYMLSFPFFISPLWKKLIDGVVKTHKIDIIIVRDLPMAISGILAGKRFNIPVIFDMAEDYVAMLRRIWKRRKFSGLNLIIRNPYLAEYVEKYTLKNIDHILVVVEESKNILLERGFSKDKVTIVENTPPIDNLDLDKIHIDKFDYDLMTSRFTLIYTGGIQLGRGIQTVFESIPEIIKTIPDFLFVIIGDGYAVDTLKKYAKDMDISDYILWKGWLDHKHLLKYISLCNVGVIPHLKTEHTDTTMPNKIYDYMLLGLPVIASDTTPMKRLIDNEKCGVTFQSGHPNDLSNSLISINNYLINYGQNGAKAVGCRYNWTEDEKRLVSTVNALISNLQ
jgi:glycosyltransferase involved in cell wall biosynthesis